MASRQLPVRPNLEQLKHQAKDLLRAVRQGDPAALAELREHHPKALDPTQAKLADAQLALARSYGLSSWPRLVTACRMTDAIWRGDVEAVREMVLKDPRLLEECARGMPDNWGPPLSYAANVGQDAIIDMLRELGATDIQRAFGRACLRGKIATARHLYAMGARPSPDEIMGPCESLNSAGMALLLEMGAELADEHGDRIAPVGMLLQTYSRNPLGKHRCFELVAQSGIVFPDTPPMAVHRGRIDLLQAHFTRDPNLFNCTFSHEEIYPPELGCHADHSFALHATPLAGTTLLHLCVDFAELEIARWIVGLGGDTNAKAAVDSEGFGGHTALFGCVVSQPYRNSLEDETVALTRLLLDHGADTNARASLRKQLRDVDDESMHEYPDVTPLSWGERFHDQDFVCRAAMKLIAERGGKT